MASQPLWVRNWETRPMSRIDETLDLLLHPNHAPALSPLSQFSISSYTDTSSLTSTG